MSLLATLNEADWELLLERIQGGKCTPFLGAGVNYNILPTGREIAERWAADYRYPLRDNYDLTRVAQFVAIKRDDAMWPKDKILRLFEEKVEQIDLEAKLTSPDNPMAVLAKLPLPIYITTNYDDFMLQALKYRGKMPYLELCCWNSFVARKHKSVLKGKSRINPTKDTPIVFHLHGHKGIPESLVLTEDDYLDFLVEVSKQQELLPPRIQEAVSSSSLLFIGYRLADMNFRVLFRGLVNSMPGALRYLSLAVQLPPDEGSEEERSNTQAYLNQYFGNVKVKVYWGKADDFVRELQERWEKFIKATTR
jgi:SIR2-like domain